MKNKLIGIVIVFICILFVNIFCDKDSFTVKSVDYNGDKLKVSIDGVESNTLPTSGKYYLANYDCKGVNTKLEWNNERYELKVSGENDSKSMACYLDFQSQPLLSSMTVGSYVEYVGNNGCVGDSCKGINANYVDDNDMGYCGNSNYKFVVNGWRIGYINNGNAYLVSAGSPECLCTNSSGNLSNSSCSSYLASADISKHVDNLNKVALNYCNTDYANGGVCDNTTTWAMNQNDFEKITKNTFSFCNGKYGDKSCGYFDDLIDNGGSYKFATPYNNLSETLFYWSPEYRGISNNNSGYLSGVRPVIKIDSNVVIVGGSGSYKDPYLIDNNTFFVNDGNTYITDKSNVKLDLIGNSKVKTMCISFETSGCSNYIDFNNSYTLDLTSEEDGKKTIYVYYKDANDTVIASLNKDIILDGTGPVGNSIKISSNNSLMRKITLKSSGANYMCLSNISDDVDNCTEWVNYTNSYDWKLSDGDGTKTVYAFFKDKVGNVSGAVSDSVIINRKCLDVNDVYSIQYTGEVVNSDGTDVKFCSGTYKLETWGAQGGNSGGMGGYSSGNIALNGMEKLYFYVGGSGGKGDDAGFNGGGTTGATGGAGGGATDIRIGSDSLFARVIVAGGGGGRGKDNCAIGGAGGGSIGIGNNSQKSCGTQAGGGTQTSGGNAGIYHEINGATSGTFGIGGNASDGIYDGGAGGGGWYGGGAGTSSDWSNGGGGGSGFVYTSESIVPNGYLISSSYYLSETVMLNGDQDSIPVISNSTTNSLNGYIKITRLS